MKNTPGNNIQKKAGTPQPAGKGAKWWASALLWPGSFKQTGVWLLAWTTLWPGGMMLFPRAEQVLEQEGLNPKIAEELAPGKKIYVRTDNLAGKFHALLDVGIIGIPLAYYGGIRKGANGGFTRVAHAMRFADMCEIYLRPAEYQYNKALYQKNLLHEIRHCSDENMKLLDYGVLSNVHVEGDADARAVEILAREKKDPHIKTDLLNQHALNPWDADHDVALYLDAAFRKVALPSVDEIARANKDAAPANKKILNKKRMLAINHAEPGFCKETDNKESCAYDPKTETLSPLAKRRVELYSAALDQQKMIVTIKISEKSGKKVTAYTVTSVGKPKTKPPRPVS